MLYLEVTEYVFLGDISDNELFTKNELWDAASNYAKGGEFWTSPECMINSYNGILDHIGIHLSLASQETYIKYIDSIKVKSMPTYPSNGSIVVNGDDIIIKLSNDY